MRQRSSAESISLPDFGDFLIDEAIPLRPCRLTAFRGSSALQVGQMWDSEIVLCNRLMLILSNPSGSSRKSTIPASILVIHSEFLIPQSFLEFEIILCLVLLVINGLYDLVRITHVT